MEGRPDEDETPHHGRSDTEATVSDDRIEQNGESQSAPCFENGAGQRDVGPDGSSGGHGGLDDETLARALQDLELSRSVMRMASTGSYFEYYDGSPEDNEEPYDEDAELAVYQNETIENIDDISYEDLVVIMEAVGTQSRGLSEEKIASLRVGSFSGENEAEEDKPTCTVCCAEFSKGDTTTHLPCNHFYHSECIKKWLLERKTCPVCLVEIAP